MTKIFQIWITADKTSPPVYAKQRMEKLKEMYSDCEYSLYTNDEIRVFLKTFFTKEVVFAYEKCRAFAFKADLVRYCLLYIYGGHYFDVNLCPEFRLELSDDAVALLGRTESPSGPIFHLDNGVMFFRNPGDPFLLQAIKQSVRNILANNYCNTPLEVTGPLMLIALPHDHMKLYPATRKNDELVILAEDKVWIKYAIGHSFGTDPWDRKSDESHYAGTNSYPELWNKKEVFKGNPSSMPVPDMILTEQGQNAF